MTERASWPLVLAQIPLIAILRGVRPVEAINIAAALEQAGFLCVEVPLNSPDPLASIRMLKEEFGESVLIGAGTVLTAFDVEAVFEAGAELIVSPNTNPAVIRAAKARGLLSLPGFTTPSEAFTALEAGADALKLFPAEATSPAVLRAIKAVLPPTMPVLPVGGITPESMAGYLEAGAAGFGIGSALYRPGFDACTVRIRAERYVAAWRNLRR
jgi:2-dehydro-3-deoxyphosphogalactonate aldolase